MDTSRDQAKPADERPDPERVRKIASAWLASLGRAWTAANETPAVVVIGVPQAAKNGG